MISGALLNGAWTISHRACPVLDNSPNFTPGLTTQMPYDFGDNAPESMSTSSELVGALGNPVANGNGGSPNNSSTSNNSNGHKPTVKQTQEDEYRFH